MQGGKEAPASAHVAKPVAARDELISKEEMEKEVVLNSPARKGKEEIEDDRISRGGGGVSRGRSEMVALPAEAEARSGGPRRSGRSVSSHSCPSPRRWPIVLLLSLPPSSSSHLPGMW